MIVVPSSSNKGGPSILNNLHIFPFLLLLLTLDADVLDFLNLRCNFLSEKIIRSVCSSKIREFDESSFRKQKIRGLNLSIVYLKISMNYSKGVQFFHDK